MKFAFVVNTLSFPARPLRTFSRCAYLLTFLVRSGQNLQQGGLGCCLPLSSFRRVFLAPARLSDSSFHALLLRTLAPPSLVLLCGLHAPVFAPFFMLRVPISLPSAFTTLCVSRMQCFQLPSAPPMVSSLQCVDPVSFNVQG